MGGRRITEPYFCEWCGERFKPRSRASRFCGLSCLAKWRNSFRDFSGANGPNFKGGLSRSEGRTIIVCRDGSWVFYYRALMEAHLRRPLRADEVVHHINGDPADDRIENLEVMSRAEHIDLHREDLHRARGIGVAA